MINTVENLTFEGRDEYNRKPIAKKVISLLTSSIPVSPMVIDGGWGTGKTEFCLKLIHLLKKEKTAITPVYIDAFQADHADEPLMTLLASILRLMPDDEKREGLIKNALPAIRFGVKTTLKAGVSWVLKQDAADLAEDFESDVKKAGDEAINNAVESLLKDHVNANESIELLKAALTELVEKKPIVIFIDELDRCRPDFAVAMLESIKHIFDVKGVEFVLITNTAQLRASINHCYGPTVDAQRYLDKFIGFSFTLPGSHSTNGHDEVYSSIEHFFMLAKESEFLSDTFLSEGGVKSLVETLVKVNKLSLREVKTFIQYLEIYQLVTEMKGLQRNIYGYALLRVFALFINCFHSKAKNELSSGVVNPKGVVPILGINRLPNLSDGYPVPEEIVAAIICRANNVPGAELVIQNGEEVKKWENIIVECFSGRISRSPEGRINIMNDVFKTMRLG